MKNTFNCNDLTQIRILSCIFAARHQQQYQQIERDRGKRKERGDVNGRFCVANSTIRTTTTTTRSTATTGQPQQQQQQ